MQRSSREQKTCDADQILKRDERNTLEQVNPTSNGLKGCAEKHLEWNQIDNRVSCYLRCGEAPGRNRAASVVRCTVSSVFDSVACRGHICPSSCLFPKWQLYFTAWMSFSGKLFSLRHVISRSLLFSPLHLHRLGLRSRRSLPKGVLAHSRKTNRVFLI